MSQESPLIKIRPPDPPESYRRLYAMLLDAIPCSILLIDRDMRIVSTNRNFLEKSRRSIADTIDRRLEAVFPPVILEYMDLTSRIRQVFEKNLPTKGERMTYRAPGLPLRIYYYSLLPFSWEGTVQNVILLMEDITEQVHLSEEVRRIERHLASIVESASDLVISTDTEERILSWNTAAEKLSGYSLAEVKGRPFSTCCWGEGREEVQRVFSRLKTSAAPKNSHMAEWDLVTKGGDRIPVSWVFSPMKDHLSRTIGMVAVGRNLKEQRKLEVQLLQSQKLAALGVMAGGIAHEIRNPLAICSSAAQFLLEGEITPEFRLECAKKIQTGIQKASVIIENLLRFARPSPRSDMTRTNLCAVVQETLTLVANQAKIQKIEVVFRGPKEPVRIHGNSSLLQQVFMNLFLNAMDAMPEGGVLRASIEKGPEEVWVRVADNGRGIPKGNLEKIFDPFYTTSTVGKGTGLGLSICYSIIKQHLGSIEVDSAEEKGSTFTIRLPRRVGE